MDENWKTIATLTGAVVVIAGIIAGFFRFHIKTFNGLKDKTQELELKIKDLQHKDEIQQIAIDRLPELYPILTAFIGRLDEKKKK